MHFLASLVQKILIESFPGIQITRSQGSNILWRIDFSSKRPLSEGYEAELERQVRTEIKSGAAPEVVEMESSGARARFKAACQPYYVELCGPGATTHAIRLGDFYLPMREEAVELGVPQYFSLIADGNTLYICSGGDKKGLKAVERAACSWESLSHLTVGKGLVRCFEGSACYTPKGAIAKRWIKGTLFDMALNKGFLPISARRGVWEFIEELGKGSYFQLELFEREGVACDDLFSLGVEGTLSLRAIGTKDDLSDALNSSLQLIDEILKMGDIIDIAPLERGRRKARALVLDGRYQEVTLAKWEISGGRLELFFFIDRWIGVLLELGQESAVNWLMKDRSIL